MLRLLPSQEGRHVARTQRERKATQTAFDSRAQLSEAEIIEGGLALLRSEGAEALSMRGLARQLGVSVMALYYYLRSKEELLDKLREAVLAKVATPPVTAQSWDAQMRAYALNGVLLLAEYPGLLRFGAMRPPTESDKRLTRHGISILLAAGCDPRTAALAIKTYHTHIFGLVIVQGASFKPRTAKRSLAGGRREDVAAVARQIGELGFRESIEFGLDTVLHGLKVQIAGARKRGRAQPARRKLRSVGKF
jgi:TetR/AcrR family tetracycline transcriptional repressor